MAVQDTKIISLTAGATFAEADKYIAVGVNSSGHAVLYSAAAGATGGQGVIGTLDSVTASTAGAGVEAVGVQTGPVVKLFMSGSTLAAGDLVAVSTADGHGVAATTNPPFGVIMTGSSGTTGRIVSVIRS